MKDKWIEYQQIREDIRHSNTIFFHTFYIIAIVLSLLVNIVYQIAKEQNINVNHQQTLLIGFLVVCIEKPGVVT